MESNVFIEFTNDELFSMVEQLNQGSVIEDSKLYDIAAFFDDKKEYTISCDEIVLIHITHDSNKEKFALMKEKKELEERLKQINSII